MRKNVSNNDEIIYANEPGDWGEKSDANRDKGVENGS